MITLYGLFIGVFMASALCTILGLDDLIETMQDYRVARKVSTMKQGAIDERTLIAREHLIMCVLDIITALTVAILAGYFRFNGQYAEFFEISIPPWTLGGIILAASVFTIRLLQRRRIRYLLLDRDRREYLQEILLKKEDDEKKAQEDRQSKEDAS